jgi:hypothetical protein
MGADFGSVALFRSPSERNETSMRITRITFGFVLGVVLLAATPATSKAGSIFQGQTLNLTYYDPNLSTPYAGSPNNTYTGVVPDTFADVIGQFDVAITNNNIYLTFTEEPSFSFTPLGVNGITFNGFVITDETSSPITDVTVDPATNLAGFTSANITFTGDQIFVDWPGLQGNTSTVVSLDVAGGTPEPSTFGLLAAGLAGLAACLGRTRRKAL